MSSKPPSSSRAMNAAAMNRMMFSTVIIWLVLFSCWVGASGLSVARRPGLFFPEILGAAGRYMRPAVVTVELRKCGRVAFGGAPVESLGRAGGKIASVGGPGYLVGRSLGNEANHEASAAAGISGRRP